MDDHARFTRLVIQEFERAAREKESYTLPWLDLDIAAFQAYRDGQTNRLPEPYASDPASSRMFAGVRGLDVLCLAGGGGQQSAVFSLLGARVTVFDLMESQLEGDRVAAAHYSTSVNTVQGDMRDLTALASASFDRVLQPISTLYTPDLAPVFREVTRVLRPGGLYCADYTVPLLYMAHNTGWDGSAYVLRVAEPYRRGEIRETTDGRSSFTEGCSIGEYHHLLSDIINNQIVAGLSIQGIWENPRPGANLEGLAPGSEAHRDRFIPFGLTVLSQKL